MFFFSWRIPNRLWVIVKVPRFSIEGQPNGAMPSKVIKAPIPCYEHGILKAAQQGERDFGFVPCFLLKELSLRDSHFGLSDSTTRTTYRIGRTEGSGLKSVPFSFQRILLGFN